MDITIALAQLAGWIALLLWGVHMAQSGIQRAFGPSLRRVLAKALGNRMMAFGAGLAITAALQSSTATALMVTSLTAGGLVDLVPALAVLLGANVGTTLIVQLMSFDVYRAAPLFVLVGVLMFRRGGTTRRRDLGRVVIGIGLILLALHQLLIVISPFEDAPTLRMLLGAVIADPLVAILLAAALTWAIHSSVAVVLLVMSFVAQGVVPLSTGLALVLGANLGTAINPLLEMPAGGDPATRRLPIGNILNRLACCGIIVALLDPLAGLLLRLEPDGARAIADFHTVFNLMSALVFLPLLAPWAWLLRRLVPARAQPADPSRPVHLDEAVREMPAIALAGAAREALRMADVLSGMLQGTIEALDRGDRKRIGETRRMDDVLDRLNGAITAYLTKLDTENLEEQDDRRLSAILSFTTNLEHAGDIIAKNLMAHATKRWKRNLAFSGEGAVAIRAMLQRLKDDLRTATAVFMTDDFRAARRLEVEELVFRDLVTRATEEHFTRVRVGRLESVETGALQLDILRDLRRINGHLVAAACPLVEQWGTQSRATKGVA